MLLILQIAIGIVLGVLLVRWLPEIQKASVHSARFAWSVLRVALVIAGLALVVYAGAHYLDFTLRH